MTVEQALAEVELQDAYERALISFAEWKEIAEVLAAEVRRLQRASQTVGDQRTD